MEVRSGIYVIHRMEAEVEAPLRFFPRDPREQPGHGIIENFLEEGVSNVCRIVGYIYPMFDFRLHGRWIFFITSAINNRIVIKF